MLAHSLVGNGMILATFFAAWAAQSAPEQALPIAASKPLFSYFGCLFDPIAEKTGDRLPAGRTEREQIVTEILARCAARRSTSRNAARLAAPSGSGKAEIERAFLAAESELRFLIVDREKAMAASDAFCRARGDEPGC